MSINLNKSATPPSSAQPAPQPTGDPIVAMRSKIASRVFDTYCDSALRAELIRHGVADLGLDLARATIILDMELEAAFCVNEHRLTEELDGLLRRFTDKDKKLDPKERIDAIQIVCKAKSGYSKGLAFDVAEKRVIEFCRANRVKVKVGLLRWDIP